MSVKRDFRSQVLLSYDELAALLNISKNSIYALVSRKRIPFVRIGPRTVRFIVADIETWLDERSREGSDHV
jgi:excisionase family DNA binding protein